MKAAASPDLLAADFIRRIIARSFRLVFISSVTIVLLLEGGARLMYEKTIAPWQINLYEQFIAEKLVGAAYFWAYRPHPYTVYEPNPGYSLPSGEVVHTEDAFRTPFVPVKKESGTFRIALVGGSVIYQNDTPVKQTYAAYLTEYLNGCFPGHRIEVLNAAVGGHNSADQLARFHFKVLDYQPDMVVVHLHMNDVWPRLFSSDFKNDYRNSRTPMKERHLPTATERKFLKYSYLYRILYFKWVLHSSLPNIMEVTYRPSNTANFYNNFLNSTPDAFRRNVESLIAIARAHGVQPVLTTTAFDESFDTPDPEKDPYYVLILGSREHNQVMREIAEKEHVELIPLDELIPKDPGIFGDVVHLSWKGNRMLTKIVADRLVPSLEQFFHTKAVTYDFPISDTAAQPLANIPAS